MVTIQKLDKDTFTKAQLMYFGGREVTEIAVVLSIEPETLRFYIFGEDGDGKESYTWHAIKRKLNPTAMALYLKDKVGVLEQTAGIGVEILSFSLGQLRDSVRSGEIVLTVDEIAKIGKVVVDLDKMVRLESGTATELIEHMGLSRAEAREILESDPFAQDVEVEAIELPWLKESVSE